MKFFGIVGIVMGLFLIISILFVFSKEKQSRKKIIADFVIYITVGIILISIGVLTFIDLFNHQNIILTGILLVVLVIFLLYISISDKKGKKFIKYKTTGHGKNKRIVEEKDKYDNKK